MYSMDPPEPRDGSLHITAYPEAVHFAAIPSVESARLSHLTLHYMDLRSAAESLEQLSRLEEIEELRVIRHALFKWSVTSFFKCFQKSAARKVILRRNDIYEVGEQQELFDYFKHIRNKMVVHDENDWTQCAVGAVVNPVGAPQRVAAVLTMPMWVIAVDEGHWNGMTMLTNAAMNWTEHEVDKEHDRLRELMSTYDHDALLALPAPQMRVPDAESVARRRPMT